MPMRIHAPSPVADVYAAMIEQAADEGERYASKMLRRGKPVPATRYDGSDRAGFHMGLALSRWERMADIDPRTFVAASVYLDRFVERTRTCLTHYNKFRLVLCAIVAADKYCSDLCMTNVQYARVGGVSPKEMNELEVQFLCDIDFDLFISSAEFGTYEACFREFGEGTVDDDDETVSDDSSRVAAAAPSAFKAEKYCSNLSPAAIKCDV